MARRLGSAAVAAAAAFAVAAATLAACGHAAPDAGEARARAVAATLVGTRVPALTVQTLDGASLDLFTQVGKRPMYLKFWATWCKPCREQMPRFEQLYETFGDRVAVLAVDAGLDDDPAAVRAFRDAHGMKMPIVVDDGRLAAALDLQVTPQHVVIDRDGRIVFVGHRDGPELDAALAKVVADAGLVAHTDDGRELRLDGVASRPRAVMLFATWCEGYLAERQPASSAACKRVREQLEALRAARTDVDFVAVAHGLWTAPPDLADYRARTHTQIPVALDADGALFRAFGVHRLGTVVLIGRDGKVARVVSPDDDLADAFARF